MAENGFNIDSLGTTTFGWISFVTQGVCESMHDFQAFGLDRSATILEFIMTYLLCKGKLHLICLAGP